MTPADEESATDRAPLLGVLMDKIPAMVAYWDATHRCRFANHAYEKWFGVRPEVVVGMSMQELLGPLYELNRPHIELALRGEAQEFEREVPDPGNGPPRYSQVHYIPHVVEGKVEGFCVLVADITRRKRAEEALLPVQRQLEARERLVAMATLAAGIAHEINNPLATVLGNIELALEDLDTGAVDTGQLRILLADALADAVRMRDIVQGMKLLARGNVTQSASVNVADTIDESVACAANMLRYRARVTCELDRDACITGNAAQLAQVFVNLLSNAARALPEETPRRNEINVTVRREGDQVAIEVADNGKGIPEELHSKIFEPFYSTHDVGEGMGLGLPISRGIVEGFGGTISVVSQVGRGSVFRVLLPAASPAAAPKPAPTAPTALPSPTPTSGIRPRLLLVDDDPAVVTLLRRGLSLDGYDITAVQSGPEALAAIDRGARTFDVILCDLMMPEMSGQDVYLEVLRSRPELAGRFVFITGGAFTPRSREFLDEVRAPVLDKPFNIQRLRQLVRERLGLASNDAARDLAASTSAR